MMKRILPLFLLMALFACDDDVSEYIKIKDVHQDSMTEGSYEFTFRMIEAGDFQLQAKLNNSTLSKDFVVNNLILKADTTGGGTGGTGSGTNTAINSISLDKTEYLIDEVITAELELIGDYEVQLAVYKRSE